MAGESLGESPSETGGATDFLSMLLADTPPCDDEGYVLSFSLPSEKEEMLNFLRRWGFVVVRDVLTSAECEDTMDEFWSRYASCGLDRDDPTTWDAFWSGQRFGRMGIIGLGSDLGSRCQLANRQNPRVHAAFAALQGTERLWSDHDRLGVMRPTRGVRFPGADAATVTVRDVPEWETLRPSGAAWLHLDCNPVEGRASIGSLSDDGSRVDFAQTLLLQALLALTDAPAPSGGFHCIPGSHELATDWARSSMGPQIINHMMVAEDDPLRARLFEVAVRKGSLLAWNSLLMHGNHPNRSSDFRAVQYLRQMPVSGTPFKPLAPEVEHYEDAPGFEMSALGRKLFGIDPWEVEEGN